MSTEPSADALIGTVLNDRFEIASLLGSGSNCHVYKATDKTDGKPVALKVLREELVPISSCVQRLEHEAKVLSFLTHSGICSVSDFGYAGERPYLVMELIDGQTLAKLLQDNGPMSAATAVGVFHLVCSALQHCHQFGVVHRGLNPSEIMLSSEDSTPKVIDFGIARSRPAGGEDDLIAQLDAADKVVGSRLYMSPEQRQGKTADARSDVYALGCVMYEALMGRPPFEAITDIELNFKHADQEPPPLTAAWSVPGSLAAVVQKAMAKEPQKRYQTMGEMAQALAGRSTKQVKMLDKIEKLLKDEN